MGFTISPKQIIMVAIAIYVAAYLLPGAFTEWFNYTSTNALVAALWFIVPLGAIVMIGLSFMKRA